MLFVALGLGLTLLSFSLPFGLTYLTYVDASVRSSDHPVLWGLLGLFIPVFGTVGYRIARWRLGEPTRPVPRRARWASKAVRAITVGLAALAVGFIGWVVFLSPMHFSDAALRTTASIPLAYGFVYWLAPTWPEKTARSPPTIKNSRESASETARGRGAETVRGRRDESAEGRQPDPRDAERGGPSLSWRGKLVVLGGLVGCLFLSTQSVVLSAPLDSIWIQFFLVVVVLMASGIFVGLVARPYFSRAFPDARPAAERVRSQYADLCRECGVPVNGVWIADDLKGNADLAEVAGVLPGKRHLFLDEELFEEYDSHERLAVVAQQASLAGGYYRLFVRTFVYLAITVYYGFLVVAIVLSGGASPFPDWPLVPEVLLLALFSLGTLHARRVVYRADRFAADETGVETVVGVLESLDARQRDSKTARIRTWVRSAVGARPSPRRRIERLRDGYSGSGEIVRTGRTAVEDSSSQKR